MARGGAISCVLNFFCSVHFPVTLFKLCQILFIVSRVESKLRKVFFLHFQLNLLESIKFYTEKTLISPYKFDLGPLRTPLPRGGNYVCAEKFCSGHFTATLLNSAKFC